MADYYYAGSDRVQYGPVSAETLLQLYQNRVLQPDVLVWTPGMPDWLPISTVFGIIPPTPAPTPYTPPAPTPYTPPAPTQYPAPVPTPYPAPIAGTYDTSKYGSPFAAYSYATKHMTFTGRATRMEYWMAYLGAVLIIFITAVAAWLMGAICPSLAVFLFFGVLIHIFLVFLTLNCRRLHDVGMTGWLQILYFIPFLGLIMACIDSDRGTNMYGPSDKYPG